MKGWLAAAVCAAGWAATCWEARRRWVEDGKALEAAREGLAVGFEVASLAGVATPETVRIARAATLVGVVLEARS